MYIRRKVYSAIQNNNGKVRLFSTTELNEKKSLKDYKSNTGLGRALISSPFIGHAGLIGGYAGKIAANKADKEGKSDKEILSKAKNVGGIVGGIHGAGAGAMAGAAISAIGAGLRNRRVNKAHKIGRIVGAATSMGLLGAIGGRNAASVNTKDRILKRHFDQTDQK